MAYSPKYLKIVELLQRRFSSGEFAVGDVFPGEIALAQELNVSRRTLRNALQVLEDDGFIIRKKGVGSVLAPVNMHRRRRRSDVAIVYAASPDAEHNYDFLLQRTMLADGIIRGVAGKGHWLRIVPLAKENLQSVLEELFHKGIDGFIYPETIGVLDVVREVVRRKLPHVIFESALELPGANVITADDYQAGYDMIKMLVEEKVKDIAVIGGVFKSELRNTANRRRFSGAMQAFRDYKVNFDERFVKAIKDEIDDAPEGWERGQLSEIIRKMLDCKDMPRTIVLSSLTVADVFIDEIKAAELDWANDFRLLTFRGSSNWGSVKNLQEVMDMEYFSCDHAAMIRQGTEMLDNWLNDPAYRAQRVYVPCSYHQGGEPERF